MHFCLRGQYTPQSLNNIMDNPTTSRYEAAKHLIETAGGKLISMYSTGANGPGVLVIFDVPDPGAAPGDFWGCGSHPVPSRMRNSSACGRRTKLCKFVKRQVSFVAHTSRPVSKRNGEATGLLATKGDMLSCLE